jgi:hypothetical protein
MACNVGGIERPDSDCFGDSPDRDGCVRRIDRGGNGCGACGGGDRARDRGHRLLSRLDPVGDQHLFDAEFGKEIMILNDRHSGGREGSDGMDSI